MRVRWTMDSSTDVTQDQNNPRVSTLMPGMEESVVKGLQYRRNSRKLSLTLLPAEIKPRKLSESENCDSTEQLVSYAPDGGYGWFIMLASFLCNFVLDGISVSQAVLMPFIRKASGIQNYSLETTSDEPFHAESLSDEPNYVISVGEYTIVSSVLLAVTLSVGPFISLLTDKYGFRIVSICGSVIASLGLFLSFAVSPYTPNIWVITVFFGIVSGIGFGMMFQPSVIIVGMYFEKWRPVATGIAISGTGAGTFAFPPILEAIAGQWGWQGAYLFQAALALFSVTFALLYLPLPTKLVVVERRANIVVGVTKSDKEPFGLRSLWKAMGPLSKSPTFLLISISGAITMLGFFGPYAFLKDKAETELKISDKDATLLMTWIGVSNWVGRLIFGLISSHPKVSSLILSNGALTVAGVATMLVPFATEHYQLIVYSIVFGFGIAIFAVLRSILVLKYMGMENFNNGFGLSLLFMGVGTALGNTIGGFLKDATGNYDISFYAAGAYLLISGVMCYPLAQISKWEQTKKEGSLQPRKSLAF